MSQKTLSRSKLVTEIGQDAVKLLVKEPVKEAVREALAEEQARLATVEEQRPVGESEERTEEDESSGSRVPVKSLLLIVALVGGVLLAKRIRDSRSGEDLPGEPVERRDRPAGGTDRGSSVEMSDDNPQTGSDSRQMD